MKWSGISDLHSRTVSTDVANTVQRHEQLLKDIHQHLLGREDKFDDASSNFLINQSADQTRPTRADNDHHDVGSSTGAIAQTDIRNEHNELRFQHLEQVFSSLTREISSDSRPNQGRSDLYSSRQCASSCRCRCHRRQRRQRELRLMAFQNSLGSFSFSFWTPFGDKCDTSSCTKERSNSVKATYTFPVWLFQATVSLLAKWAVSPELILRVHRRVEPIADTLFIFVARGDVDNVKRLLLNKEAAVTDVKAFGGESILHTAYNLRHRAKGFSLIRLLVQEGADWFQEKDNGHMPSEFTTVPTHTTWHPVRADGSLLAALSFEMVLDSEYS